MRRKQHEQTAPTVKRGHTHMVPSEDDGVRSTPGESWSINPDQVIPAMRADSRVAGRILARHAYGFSRWVDLLGTKLNLFEDPPGKVLVSSIIHKYAQNMKALEERAHALGVDPASYVIPPEGAAVYDRLEELTTKAAVVGFVLGSLEFSGGDARFVEGHDARTGELLHESHLGLIEIREALRSYATQLGHACSVFRDEAIELYERREPRELQWYLSGSPD
jgi:hypothetical protein